MDDNKSGKNAYQKLGVLTNELEKGNSEAGGLSRNSKIKLNAVRLLKFTIRDMHIVLNNVDLSNEKKIMRLMELSDSQKSLCYAYEQIKDEASRAEYDKKGKPSIDEMCIKESENLDEKNILKRKDKSSENDKEAKEVTLSAYDVLPIEIHGDKTDREYSKNACQTALRKITFYLSTFSLETMDDLKDATGKIKDVLWAYQKISTPQKRENYDLALKGEKLENLYTGLQKQSEHAFRYNIAIWQYHKIKEDSNASRLTINQNDKSITIRKKGALSYSDNTIIPNENQLYAYDVTKTNEDGTQTVSQIVSDINLIKMREDDNYKQQVLTELLSNESIYFGNKYLSSYVGRINEKGEKEFDPNDIAACYILEEKLKAAKGGERAPTSWKPGLPFYEGGSVPKTGDEGYMIDISNLFRKNPTNPANQDNPDAPDTDDGDRE